MNKLYRMAFDLLMDRPVIVKNDKLPFSPHYIVPEGYTIQTKLGDKKRFDFNQVEWSRDKHDRSLLHIEVSDFDDEFGDKIVTSEDMSGCKWLEFNINTGDESTPPIRPEHLTHLIIEFKDDEANSDQRKHYGYCCQKYMLDQINNDCIEPQRWVVSNETNE